MDRRTFLGSMGAVAAGEVFAGGLHAESANTAGTVPPPKSTRPFVDARGPSITSALGRDSPDTDKIYSIVLRDSSPLHNQVTPGREGQVKGTHRAGAEPQGFARQKAANQHRHKVKVFSKLLGFDATLL